MNAIFAKIWAYLTFKKPDPNATPPNFSLRAMHLINKISILLFLVGMIILITKWLS